MNSIGTAAYDFSGIPDGNMNIHAGTSMESVLENRRRFLGKSSLDPGSLVLLRQVHGDTILVVEGAGSDAPLHPHEEGDALITGKSGITLGIVTADCIPIIILDKKGGRGIGVIHAGRIGSSLGITYKTVKKFAALFNVPPRDLAAVIGPGIGKCCYEVDERSLLPFRTRFGDLKKIAESGGPGKWRLDLNAVNEFQLFEAGLPEENVRRVNRCTLCGSGHYSYRRDRTPDRNLSIVTLLTA